MHFSCLVKSLQTDHFWTAKWLPSKILAWLIKIVQPIESWSCSMYEESLLPLCCRQTASQIAGQRIGVFSYGSGFAATLYSLRVTQDHTPGKSAMVQLCDLDGLRTYRN